MEARVSGFTGADALSPALGGMLFPDLFQRFAVFPVLPDRAQALERAWEVAWRDGCKTGQTCDGGLIAGPFDRLWAGQDAKTWRPYVIVNGAGEENGRPILTSRLKFPSGEIDADDFYANSRTDIAASTAIHNGARFPWISPAGGMLQGHIVDGGYFEGSGLETVRQLAMMINQLATAEAAAAKDGPQATNPAAKPVLDPGRLKFVVIFIGYVPKPPAKSKAFLNDVNAPFQAIFNARAAAGPHMVTALVKDFDPGPGSNAYRIASNQTGSALQGVYAPILLRDGAPLGSKDVLSPPLNWALSKRVQAYMRQSMGFDGGKLSDENEMAFEQVAKMLPAKP